MKTDTDQYLLLPASNSLRYVKQSCKHTESSGEILGCDNKTILASTLLSSRSHNGFLTFYVTSADFISCLISLACPVVSVMKGDHNMRVVKCKVNQNVELVVPV